MNARSRVLFIWHSIPSSKAADQVRQGTFIASPQPSLSTSLGQLGLLKPFHGPLFIQGWHLAFLCMMGSAHFYTVCSLFSRLPRTDKGRQMVRKTLCGMVGPSERSFSRGRELKREATKNGGDGIGVYIYRHTILYNCHIII